MDIKETAQKIYQNNVNHGFWEEDQKNVAQKLMLVVSELSEAMEADRANKRTGPDVNQYLYFDGEEGFKHRFEFAVKNTFEDEIADAVIRLFDISIGYGFDLEWHIEQKMKYNAMREFKHGKKY